MAKQRTDCVNSFGGEGPGPGRAKVHLIVRLNTPLRYYDALLASGRPRSRPPSVPTPTGLAGSADSALSQARGGRPPASR